jgi:hypothetical protein
MPAPSMRLDESFQSGKPNLDTFSGGRIDPGSLEPLVFSAQPFKRQDAGIWTTQGPAYPFLKQKHGNPKNKHCPHQTRKYEQHCKYFLDDIETHFTPTRPVFL